MQLLSKSDVFAENKLFATVDSTVRKIVLDGIPFLLTDTVGFIRKLPTTLVECFKSTLDEIREADILLHVVDISHGASHEQIEVVNSTLAEIGAGDKPMIMVYNKVDALPEEERLELLEAGVPEPSEQPIADRVFISATQRENIEALRKKLTEQVEKRHFQIFPNYLKPQVYDGQWTYEEEEEE
jgi:GTPase